MVVRAAVALVPLTLAETIAVEPESLVSETPVEMGQAVGRLAVLAAVPVLLEATRRPLLLVALGALDSVTALLVQQLREPVVAGVLEIPLVALVVLVVEALVALGRESQALPDLPTRAVAAGLLTQPQLVALAVPESS